MFLHGGQMQGVALGAERGELVQQVMVQMTVVLEPVGAELVAGQVRRDVGEYRRQPLAQRRAAMDDVVEVRSEELLLQQLDRQA